MNNSSNTPLVYDKVAEIPPVPITHLETPSTLSLSPKVSENYNGCSFEKPPEKN
jgi:hypothetical protein